MTSEFKNALMGEAQEVASKLAARFATELRDDVEVLARVSDKSDDWYRAQFDSTVEFWRRADENKKLGDYLARRRARRDGHE